MFAFMETDENEPLLLTSPMTSDDKVDRADHCQHYEDLYDHHLSMFSPSLPTKMKSVPSTSRNFFGVNIFGNASKSLKDVIPITVADMTQHGEMVYFPTTLQPIGSPGNQYEHVVDDTLPFAIPHGTTLSPSSNHPPLTIVTNEEDLMNMQFAGLGMQSTPYSSPEAVIDGFEHPMSTPPPNRIPKHTETVKKPINDVLWFNVAGK